MLRLGLLAMVVALLLAVAAGQSSALQAMYPGSEPAASQTSDSQYAVPLGHWVFANGCAQGDLHVIRYGIGADDQETVMVFSVCTGKEKE